MDDYKFNPVEGYACFVTDISKYRKSGLSSKGESYAGDHLKGNVTLKPPEKAHNLHKVH